MESHEVASIHCQALGYGSFLKHVGLDHIEKFTRADWSNIRRSLGKPRRLSLGFLRKERLVGTDG
jgi:hypothetical protein